MYWIDLYGSLESDAVSTFKSTPTITRKGSSRILNAVNKLPVPSPTSSAAAAQVGWEVAFASYLDTPVCNAKDSMDVIAWWSVCASILIEV